MQPVQRPIDRSKVSLDDLGAPPTVGLDDRRLDLLDRLLALHDSGDGEEAGLQHRVDPPAEPGIPGNAPGIDHIELKSLSQDLLLDRAGKQIPDAVGRVRRVEEQRRAGRRPLEYLGTLQQPELVTSDETGLRDQVRRADGLGTKTQVRGGLRSGLLGGCVREVCAQP